MDPLGALQATIALAVYPGGLFMLGVAALMGRAGGLPIRTGISAADAAGILAAMLAASLAPLPGSVLSTLPPPPAFGPPPNLAAAIILVAAAITLVAGEPWNRRRAVAAAAPLIPVLLLSAAAATLSLPILVSLPGAMVLAVRGLIAGSLLAAGSTLLLSATAQSAARTTVLSGIAILAAATALGPVLDSLPAPAAAAVVAAASTLYGLIAGRSRRLRGVQTALTIFAAVQGVAAVATILVARV